MHDASKGSAYSITERRFLELIPVFGSQPEGDVSNKPGGKLPLLVRLQIHKVQAHFSCYSCYND